MKRIMKGVICAFNKKLGKAVASTEAGYAVFETGKIPIDIGETVFGALDHEGEEVVWLESTGDNIEVVIEASHSTIEVAKELVDEPLI